MKKVIGIFLTMVVVFMFASMALAENNPKGYEGSEVANMVEEWIKSNSSDVYLTRTFDQGVAYEYGVICTSDYKELTGEDLTLDGLKEVYLNGTKYGCDYDASEVTIKTIGFHESYDVYKLEIKTTNMPLCSNNGIDYYRGEAIFMICED